MSLAAVGASVGLGRLAAQRVRADLSFLLAVWLVLLAATTLVAASFQYNEAVAIGGLRRAVLDAEPADRGMSVTTTASPAQVASFDTIVSGILGRALGPVAPVTLAARSASLAPLGMASDQAASHLTVLGSYAGIEQHAQLTAGSWPTGGQTPVQATLSVPAARALGMKVGDQLELIDASVAGPTKALMTVVVTGTWTADPDDPFWLGDPLDLDGISGQTSLAYRGPFMVAPDDLLTRGLIAHLSLTWRAGLTVADLGPSDISSMQQAIPGIAPSLGAALPPHQPVSVSTGLTPVLATVEQSLALAQGGVTLLTLQFIVLAVFAVILVAALLAERRRRENRILVSRGGTQAEILMLTGFEAILVTVPAVVLAPPAAALAIHILGAGGPLASAGVDLPLLISSVAIVAAAFAGLFAVAVLIAPAVPVGNRVSSIRLAFGREGSHVAAQRFGIDLALLLVAGLCLWQLRLYGSPVIEGGGGLGIDPLLVAGPAIGLAACSLLATRALPRLARLVERAVVNRPNVVTQLVAHDLARRPLRSIRSTLLVMLAAGLTTFALVYDATWFQSQADQAAYQSVADIRVVTPAYAKVPGAFLGPSYRAVPGVTAASPAVRTTLDIGGTVRSADLLGIDAAQVASQADLPGGPKGPLATSLSGLAAGRPSVPALALPGQPLRLQVTLDSALSAVAIDGFGLPAGEVVPAPQGIEVDALVIDGDGETWRFESTNMVDFSGSGETLDIPLQPSASTEPSPAIVSQLTPPVRLESLEVVIEPPNTGTPTTGTIDIRGVQASGETSGDSWTAVPFDAGQPGWSWQRLDQLGWNPYVPPVGQPNRIAIDSTDPIQIFDLAGSSPAFRISAVPTGGLTVDAIASTGLLAATGQAVGDTIDGSLFGNPIHIQIVGEAPSVPPLDATKPFLVVDAPTLSLADYFNSGETIPVTEWWLSIEPGQATAVSRLLAAPPFSATTIVSREAIQHALQGDPVALGVVGALLLGAISAILFAALGFLVSGSASIESRADEFGLLRALGLTDSELMRWLAVEQALLLAVGVAVGMALGIAFGWIVLPAANFTPTGAAPVPPATLVVPWPVLAAMALGSLALLLATLLVARRILSRVSVAATLRAVVE
jgi:FtsX-like permease family